MPLTLYALKPELKELGGPSLGTQLRKRRRELKLRRCDAAATLGCDAKSLMWWERDEREPAIRFYPAIIELLGGEPWPTPATTSERLLAERRRRGLTIREAADLAQVDEATFLNWGLGATPKHQSTKVKLALFLRDR